MAEESIVGIVPMACEELFRKIEEKKASGDNHEFQVGNQFVGYRQLRL